jgi:L-serine/L-threonine ammonia-lyase
MDVAEVPIVTLETIGSDCFFHSMSLNNGRFNSLNPLLPSGVDIVHDKENDVKLAHFNGFSSKASDSLGASQPSARVVKMALERQGKVECVSIPDELSMQSLASFTGMLLESLLTTRRNYNVIR